MNTGDFYGMGHNELLVGRAIEGRRDQALISVKFGALRSPSGQMLGIDARPNAVKNFAAYSLQRLGVDVIDIYQPGRVDPSVPVEETVGAIADLIKEGKVRYLGLSETGTENIRRAHEVHPVTALEIEYSLGTRFIEKEILPTVRELGIGLVAYGVVGRLEKVSLLERMAREKNCRTPQLAIAWVLSRGKDIVPLVGMSRRARLAENLKAFDVALTKEDLDDLDGSFALGAITGDRYPGQMKHLTAK